MSQTFTLQALVDRTRRAEKRIDQNRQRRLVKRQKRMAAATVAQLHHNLSDLPYIRQLFPLTGEPTVEHCGKKLVLATQPVVNTIEEETLATQFEQYCGDLSIYLRLTHEPSTLFTCVKLTRFQRADRALHQISYETDQLLAAVRAWHSKEESNHSLAQQISKLMHDWYQLYTAWDNQCIQIAQDLLDKYWTSHMLYRLSYVSATNPTQADSDKNQVESIVTCTEPNSGRISYINVEPNGDHNIQLILGDLLKYEPLIFQDKPEINQSLPYHVCHTVGHHTVYLPPCKAECHEPLHPPPERPDLSLFLSENGIDSVIAGTLGLYLDEEIDYHESIQVMLKLTPEEFVMLNPDGIFSL